MKILLCMILGVKLQVQRQAPIVGATYFNPFLSKQKIRNPGSKLLPLSKIGGIYLVVATNLIVNHIKELSPSHEKIAATRSTICYSYKYFS